MFPGLHDGLQRKQRAWLSCLLNKCCVKNLGSVDIGTVLTSQALASLSAVSKTVSPWLSGSSHFTVKWERDKESHGLLFSVH